MVSQHGRGETRFQKLTTLTVSRIGRTPTEKTSHIDMSRYPTRNTCISLGSCQSGASIDMVLSGLTLTVVPRRPFFARIGE